MARPLIGNDTDLFLIRTTNSTQHSVFAETLRDWRDPLLQGHEPNPVRACARCAACRCHSLTDLSSTSANLGHNHEPSCPKFLHRHLRATSSMKQRFALRSQRRATSSTPGMRTLTVSSFLHVQPSSTASYTRRVNSSSRIPVRVFTTTPPVVTNRRNDALQAKSKIPRLRVTCPRSPAPCQFEADR